MYVHLTIASGKDILGPEGPYISFPHNFTKKYFFSKVRLVSDSARRDLSKEPIKGWGLCKSASDLIMSSRSGLYHKVHYYNWKKKEFIHVGFDTLFFLEWRFIEIELSRRISSI